MINIKQRLQVMIATFIIIFAMGGQAAIPSTVAACGSDKGTSKQQILYGTGQTGTDCSGSGVKSTVSAFVNILSIIVGIAAVIMVIVSGFKYITSGGDSSKVGSAKSTLIYALVGMVIATLAQLLIHFVFNTAVTNSTTVGS